MTYRFLTVASLFALISACSAQGPSAVDPLTQGQNAYLSGDYGTAESAYNAALGANPSNGTALLGLAEVYEQTGRTAQAIEIYERIQRTRTGSIRVWGAGSVPQDGVTEVAARRLGLLGGTPRRAVAQAPVRAPAPVAPTTYVAPQQTVYSAPAPVIDQSFNQQRTVVYTGEEAYYAGQAPQSVQVAVPQTFAAPPVYSAPEVYTAPIATETYSLPVAAPAPIQETYTYGTEAIVVEPAVQSTYVPESVDEAAQPDPWNYALDDEGNISYGAPEGADLPTTEIYTAPPAPATGYDFSTPLPPQTGGFNAAPAYEFDTPVDGASLYSPADVQTAFQSDPIDPTEVLTPDYSRFAPAPAQSASFPVATQRVPEYANLGGGALPQPGYTVVDGDLVYVSADDLRSGNAPAAASQSYEYDIETLNGIPGLDLN